MDITIGQFYPVNSKIHRLDPRIKLLATLVYIIDIFVVKSYIGYGLATILLALVVYMSKVPFKLLFKSLKGIVFIILFTVFLNMLFTSGDTVLLKCGIIKITQEGVDLALRMAIRLILLIIGSSILTLTTSPIQLTDAIEYSLKPFKKIGVPAHEIAMMMTIALRFIPTLIEELDKIRKAQMARGADFDTGGIVKKAKSLVPLLVPLFISSFRRADELAMAMEARCYRGDINRTRLNQLVLKARDYIAIIILVIVSAVFILGRIFYGL